MAGALAILQGLKLKMSGGCVKEYQECRTLQVDMPTPSSVDIEFRDLTMKVATGFKSRDKKTILKGVSGHFRSGELTAIMGPSGAGKSSLMNALTGFSTNGVSGTIRAGNSVCKLGSKLNELRFLKEYRKKSCYILQDDQLNPLFTVMELMRFAADLKLGETLTEKLKMTVINDVLDTLGLSGTEDTRCANLSGGQRKRLSIAVELIDNPPVVFLDEPTTGLDSMTSGQCIELLKKLATNGRTVVCTVHQPSASIYALFDQVYVLAEGMCVYHGSSENTVPYLASFGLQCPMYHNPADYMLEIANCEYGNFNEVLSNNQRKGEWCKPAAAATVTENKTAVFSCGKTTIAINPPDELYKFRILLRRSVIQLYRDWTVTHLKVMLHMMIGFLLGFMYIDSGGDASRTINNIGFLFVCNVYLCYTSLIPAVLRFPTELPVIKKENFNNWYNLKTYYAAVLVTSIPVQIWYVFVYSVPSYFLSGQPQDLQRFAMFVLVLSMMSVLADSIGNVIGTCVNPINGTFIAAVFVCASVLFSGFLVFLPHMNGVMRKISYGSFLQYCFEGLILALYGNNRESLVCPIDEDYCHLRNPQTIIKTFSFKYDNYWIDIAVLFVEVLVVRILAYWTLRRSVKRSA